VEKQWSGCFDERDASQWLHFQQLDGKRHWVLHWIHQSNLDHAEWAYHRDGHFHSEPQPYSNAHGYSNADPNSNTDGHAYANTDTN